MIQSSAVSIFKMLSVLAFVALAQVSCGGDSESGNIDFDPENNPIAINADLTIGTGDDEVVIKKPWYLFRYTIKSTSEQTLYLVTLNFKVSGTKNGITTTKTYSIDPGKDCADDYSRPFLGIIRNGQTFTGYDIDASGDPFSRCAIPPAEPTPLASGFEGWYLSALPDSDNLIYTVQITGEGWFENSAGVITERAYIYGFQVTR